SFAAAVSGEADVAASKYCCQSAQLRPAARRPTSSSWALPLFSSAGRAGRRTRDFRLFALAHEVCPGAITRPQVFRRLAPNGPHRLLGDASFGGRQGGGQSGHVTLARQERRAERRPDGRRLAAQSGRPTQQANRLAGSRVRQERNAQTQVHVRRVLAFTRVLHGKAQDLLGAFKLAELHVGAPEQREAARHRGARLGAEHLTLGRAQEDRERRGPGAEQLNHVPEVARLGGRFGIGDARQIDGALPLPARDAIVLLAHVRAQTRPKRRQVIRLLGAVVDDVEVRTVVVDAERREFVTEQRSEQEVAHTDVSLQTLDIRSAGWERCTGFFLHESRDQTAPKLAEWDALHRAARFVTHREVDDGVVRDAPIDRERRDARARDHREREEALTDDVAQSLKAADRLTNAFEPAIGTDGFQGIVARTGHPALTLT